LANTVTELTDVMSVFDTTFSVISTSATCKPKTQKHKTSILPVVLHGCEICSLTLKEEHRLRAFENGVLRRIFEPKRKEVAGWTEIHNDD